MVKQVDPRSAKRAACWRAAYLIRDAMGHGWPADHFDGDAGPETAAVVAGLNELIVELERRGHA